MPEIFDIITRQIQDLYSKSRPILVCVDGVDGSGKSFFAKNLAQKLDLLNKTAGYSDWTVVQASTDDFHNPKQIRYSQGRESATGFYEDSFNYPKLKELLLNPFKKGVGFYKTKYFDCDLDKQVECEYEKVKSKSILIFEGIFSLRPELRDYWDLSIFLDVGFDETLKRNISRDQDLNRLNDAAEVERMYKLKYQPGQELYFQDADPKSFANIVVNNSDYLNPVIK
ncbi:MAG: uridine kinase [bacterium]